MFIPSNFLGSLHTIRVETGIYISRVCIGQASPSTPASSGSIMIRPQYSHTITFL